MSFISMYFIVQLFSMSIVIGHRIPQLHYRSTSSPIRRLFLVFEIRFLVLEWKSFVNCTPVLDVVS